METVWCIHLYKLELETEPIVGDTGGELYAIAESVEAAKMFIRQHFREAVFIDERVYNQGAWIALGTQYRYFDEYQFVTFALIERAIFTRERLAAPPA